MQYKAKFNVKYFLPDMSQYPSISTDECFQHHKSYFQYLKKMILQIFGNILEDNLLSQKVFEVQNGLYHTRQTTKFQIIFT